MGLALIRFTLILFKAKRKKDKKIYYNYNKKGYYKNKYLETINIKEIKGRTNTKKEKTEKGEALNSFKRNYIKKGNNKA